MKKIIALILSMMFVLSGCGFLVDGDNPLSGKSTEERIVMSLEKTYPEHTFTVIKEYSDGYAICADEAGMEFRVDTMIYDNTYHFGCHDEYLKEVLFRQDYLQNAIQIAERNGYRIEYDEENENISLRVDIANHDVDLNHVAKTLLDIINTIENIPKVVYGDYGFSTGEVNYYTMPKMNSLLCGFMSSELEDVYTVEGIKLIEKNHSVESIVEVIEEELQTAYNQEAYFSEEHQTEAAEKNIEGYLCEKDFGSYIVPEGWEELEMSEGGRYVYAKEGSDLKVEFNNFVIGCGENNYPEEEHELFKNAILQQLTEKLKNIEGVTLNGTGTYTEKGYVLYIFTITEESGAVTTYYYIVGDWKYCIIQKSNYDSSSECDEVVQMVVDSFEWAE